MWDSRTEENLSPMFIRERAMIDKRYPTGNGMLDQAAWIFVEQEQFTAATGVLAALAERDPNYQIVWTALGRCLMALAGQANDSKSFLTRLILAISCVKRALVQHPHDTSNIDWLEQIRQNSPLTEKQFSEIEPFKDDFLFLLASVNFKPEILISATRAIAQWEKRTQIIMFLGSQYPPAFLPILIDAIDNDPHPDVVMAALKRIAPFYEQEVVRHCLERLIRGNRWQQYHPYPLMALEQIPAPWAVELRKLISEDEVGEWQKIPIPAPQSTVSIYIGTEDTINKVAEQLTTVLGIENRPPNRMDEFHYMYTFSFEDPKRWLHIQQNTVLREYPGEKLAPPTSWAETGVKQVRTFEGWLATNYKSLSASHTETYPYLVHVWASSTKAPNPLAAARHFARHIFDQLKAARHYKLLMIDDELKRLGEFNPE
jgi:hypothetical protein